MARPPSAGAAAKREAAEQRRRQRSEYKAGPAVLSQQMIKHFEAG